jgi:cell wall assembly regulator SMI1
VQKFTRPLTREIELGGERIALTLSQEGVAVRPVGSRKPPHEISWAGVLCAVTRSGAEPTAEEVSAAVAAVKKGGTAKPAAPHAAAPAAPAGQAASPAPAVQTTAAPPGGGLSDLLARLGRWLQQHRRDFAEGLHPGAKPEELDALQARLGRPLPDSLRTLLAWHNGQKEEVMGGFEQDWRLMSTEEIARARQDLEAAGGSQPAWIPVFEDGNGDYLFVDTSSPAAPVRAYWAGRPDQPQAAPSLEAWFQDFVSAVESGQYHEEAERGTFFRKRA